MSISSDERILVAGPAWVGDMVMAQSLFISLKQARPGIEIDVLAPEWSLPILSRMPEVRKAISLPVGHGQLALVTRLKVGRALRKEAYTRAIIIPRSYKAALVPFFARIPRRTGYRGEMRYGVINDMRQLDKQLLTQTVQRYVELGIDNEVNKAPLVPQPCLIVDETNQQRLLEVHQLTLDRPVIGLIPGAEYGPAKQWPMKYYAALADRLLAKGYQVWIFGSARERELGQCIVAGKQGIINLCGKTQLVDAVDLIALTDKIVTNDSGLMHVACATGRKVIAIYGLSLIHI